MGTQAQSDATRRYWASLTPEEYKARIAKQVTIPAHIATRMVWAFATPTQRKQRLKWLATALSAAHKARKGLKHSNEVKQKMSTGQRKYWSSVSKQELLRRTARRNIAPVLRAGVAKYEKAVQKCLSRLHISYQSQITFKGALRSLGKLIIVDIYLPDRQTVIECDSREHLQPTARKKDQARDAYLTSIGVKVIRIQHSSLAKNGITATVKHALGL